MAKIDNPTEGEVARMDVMWRDYDRQNLAEYGQLQLSHIFEWEDFAMDHFSLEVKADAT